MSELGHSSPYHYQKENESNKIHLHLQAAAFQQFDVELL